MEQLTLDRLRHDIRAANAHAGRVGALAADLADDPALEDAARRAEGRVLRLLDRALT